MGGSGCYWVYILLVKNGTYYTGSTSDIHRRYAEHVSGTGRCRYTRSFPPVCISQCWEVQDSRGAALRIEQFVKRKTRKIKTDLIRNPALLADMLRKSGMIDFRVEPCASDVLDDINNLHEKETPGKRR